MSGALPERVRGAAPSVLALPVSKRTATGKINVLAFPVRPGESDREWRARYRVWKKGEQEKALAGENREQEGLKIFCEEANVKLSDLVARLGGEYQWWVERSLKGNWELLRANTQASKALAGGEARLVVARRIDGLVVDQVERGMRVAGGAYLKLIDSIVALPERASEMTADDAASLAEDAGEGESDRAPVGTIEGVKGRPGPKKTRAVLLRNKLGLLNDATRGLLNMANQARAMGLVSVPEGPRAMPAADGNTSSQNDRVVNGVKVLNSLLQAITNGQVPQARPEKQVLETTADVP